MKKLQCILLCVVLCVGSLSGIRMRPEEIEELMRTMNEPKVVRKFAVEDRDDDPPPDLTGGFRIS